MADRGRRVPPQAPNLNIIDLRFDDNPCPVRRTKKDERLVTSFEKTYSRVKTPPTTANREEGGQNDLSTTSKELLSYALRMNSHQIAKELILDEEDVNFIQETSSFLTGNTDLHNTGSIRRELSEEQAFAKAVIEVERARARIIKSAVKGQPIDVENSHTQGSTNIVSANPPNLKRDVSEVESEAYSENYESDFSADSIEEAVSSSKDSSPVSQVYIPEEEDKAVDNRPKSKEYRIISDLTDDYEEDYEQEEDDAENMERPKTSSSARKLGALNSDSSKGSDSNNCNDVFEGDNGQDNDVYEFMNDLVEHDSDSEQQDESDDIAHEQSILKRLREAHAQRSPSHVRLSRDTTPVTNYFSSLTSHHPLRSSNDDNGKKAIKKVVMLPPENLPELDLLHEHDNEQDHEEYSIQYSQLKSNDNFSVGTNSKGNRDVFKESFQLNRTENSKFSASTQSSHNCNESKGEDKNDESDDDEPLSMSIAKDQSIRSQQFPSDMVVVDEGACSSIPLPTPGRLSDNENLNYMISGGLNEWLVMNMKENTSQALKSLNKRLDNHHILRSNDTSAADDSSNYHRELENRFSIYTEVYQRYLSEAVALKEQYDNDVRLRNVAHNFTGNILQQVGRPDERHSNSPPPPKDNFKRRHSAKAKDDFDIITPSTMEKNTEDNEQTENDDADDGVMQRSEPKRYYRDKSVGKKLTSASVQIECVSRIEGGRNEPLDNEDDGNSEGRRDSCGSNQSDPKGLPSNHDDGFDEAILLSRSFGNKRNEIRRKNRRAIYAAMNLGAIAGKIVLERSKSATQS